MYSVYPMKSSIGVLCVNGNDTLWVHSFIYIWNSLHDSKDVVFKNITSNIHIYNINNNKMRKSNLWEFHMLHYLSVSQKQWNVRLNVWQTLQPLKMRSVSLTFSTESNDLIKQCSNFKVLSLVVNARLQHSTPQIDGLVDDAVLQFSPDGDNALH